jgi:hypothetical protein
MTVPGQRESGIDGGDCWQLRLWCICVRVKVPRYEKACSEDVRSSALRNRVSELKRDENVYFVASILLLTHGCRVKMVMVA